MSGLRDLYQDVIIDHSKNPRNFYPIEDASHQSEGFNPLCGDRLKLFLTLKGDVIDEVSFTGSGCAISTASASLMTECLKGKTVKEAKELFKDFHNVVTSKISLGEVSEKIGKLGVLAGVCEFPVRVKCATLAWHALCAALDQLPEAVSTE